MNIQIYDISKGFQHRKQLYIHEYHIYIYIYIYMVFILS